MGEKDATLTGLSSVSYVFFKRAIPLWMALKLAVTVSIENRTINRAKLLIEPLFDVVEGQRSNRIRRSPGGNSSYAYKSNEHEICKIYEVQGCYRTLSRG